MDSRNQQHAGARSSARTGAHRRVIARTPPPFFCEKAQEVAFRRRRCRGSRCGGRRRRLLLLALDVRERRAGYPGHVVHRWHAEDGRRHGPTESSSPTTSRIPTRLTRARRRFRSPSATWKARRAIASRSTGRRLPYVMGKLPGEIRSPKTSLGRLPPSAAPSRENRRAPSFRAIRPWSSPARRRTYRRRARLGRLRPRPHPRAPHPGRPHPRARDGSHPRLAHLCAPTANRGEHRRRRPDSAQRRPSSPRESARDFPTWCTMRA